MSWMTLPADVRQAEVAAAVAIGELGVVDAEQVQHGRVQVVDVHRLLDRLEAEVVGRAVDRSALDAAAGQPHREAERIVVAAVLRSCRRRRRLRITGVRPNSEPQTTSVSLNRPRCFRSLITAANGWSESFAFLRWAMMSLCASHGSPLP